MKWFEELPLTCPPSEASDCDGIYYRVANGNPATSTDFFSQRRLAPNKTFLGEGIDECIVRAVSVFADIEDAKRLLKLPKFKKASIAEVCLDKHDGKTLKTFKKSHYSWWRSLSFDVHKAKIVNYE